MYSPIHKHCFSYMYGATPTGPSESLSALAGYLSIRGSVLAGLCITVSTRLSLANTLDAFPLSMSTAAWLPLQRPVIMVSFTPLETSASQWPPYNLKLCSWLISRKQKHFLLLVAWDAFLSHWVLSLKERSGRKQKFGSTTETFYLWPTWSRTNYLRWETIDKQVLTVLTRDNVDEAQTSLHCPIMRINHLFCPRSVGRLVWHAASWGPPFWNGKCQPLPLN